jgi:cell division protein FtsB
MTKPENLPFDQFQRYSTAAELIGLFSGSGPLQIIELGAGSHQNLRAFIPEADLVMVDKEIAQADAESGAIVKGDATDLDFADDSADVVVCLDVLEHVAEELRASLIGESYRIARRAVILAFPCGAESTARAERQANAVWRKYFGQDYPWLREHFANGLPEPGRVAEMARELTPYVCSFGHGSLKYWLPMMQLHFLKEACPAFAPTVSELDFIYNRHISGTDTVPRAYRAFVVLVKDESDHDKVSSHIRDRGPASSGEPLDIAPLLGKLYEAGDRLVETEIKLREDSKVAQREIQGLLDRNLALEAVAAENDRLLAVLSQSVAERDRDIAALNEALAALKETNAGLNETVAELRSLLDRVLGSTTWRITAPLRAAVSWLRRLNIFVGI